MKKPKIDWQLIGIIAMVVVFVLIIGLCVFLKIWVFCEYGDLPITEVPSWAIPWLINQGGR